MVAKLYSAVVAYSEAHWRIPEILRIALQSPASNEFIDNYTMKIFGRSVGGTAPSFPYARSLRLLQLFLVLAAQPPNILTYFKLKRWMWSK
jgi:hypothetical protein